MAQHHGVPFLAAGQVFEVEPRARKWLSLPRTEHAEERFVEAGALLLSCSGTVGRVTVAHSPHVGKLITHDLLRIEPRDPRLHGWLYAYMRTESFRAMATGAHYGHVVKHLEPSHVSALPVIDLDDGRLREFNAAVRKVFDARDRAHALISEAENQYAHALSIDLSDTSIDEPFTLPARSVLRARRRLDGYHHNVVARRIAERMAIGSTRLETLQFVTHRVWWPDRFRRVFGDNGTPYLSAIELFDLNPTVTKRIYAGLVANADDYFLESGWLLMARSGQIYGLNGRVFLVSQRHTRAFISEDLIRIAPRRGVIRPGYLLTVLGHPVLGRPLVLRHAYGTSIPHLEPRDLADLAIPRLAVNVEDAIADRVEEAAQLRSDADDLEDVMTGRAEDVIEVYLHDDV